jgi:hypothetical protein
MKFFMPAANSPEQAEQAYQTIRTELRAAEPDRRVYSVEYKHDGSRCVARVGDRVTSATYFPQKRGGTDNLRYGEPVETGAPVLAIFPGSVWQVYQSPVHPTQWENPFLVGPPMIIHVEYFD